MPNVSKNERFLTTDELARRLLPDYWQPLNAQAAAPDPKRNPVPDSYAPAGFTGPASPNTMGTSGMAGAPGSFSLPLRSPQGVKAQPGPTSAGNKRALKGFDR
jgi:hypothetical protein